MDNRRCPWLVVALLFTGCNCGKHGGSDPDLLPSDGIPTTRATVNFGNVRVGATVGLKLPLSNTGSGPLAVTQQTISGAPFALTASFKGTIAPGGSSMATLSFAPSQAGPASGTFTIVDNGAPSKVVVTLLGNGLDLNLDVNPTSLDFGQVPVGTSPSPTQNVTLQNANTAPVYVSFSTSGLAPEYTVTDSSGNALATSPTALAPNATQTIVVAFTPDSVSVFNSGFTYSACEDAAGTTCLPAQQISVDGQGVSGELTLTPNPISFNSVVSGSTAQQQVTATNDGSAAIAVTCLYLQSQGPSACGAASGSLALGAPSQALPATLQPGDTLIFTLTYTASDPSGATDTLAATYTPQGLATPSTATDPVVASANAAPCAISFSPPSVLFDPVTVGTPVTQSVTLSNGGGTTCNVSAVAIDSASDPSYALASGQATSFTVAPAASATVGITFNLNTNNPPSTRLGKLDFQSDDPANASVQVPLAATLATPYAGGGAWPRWHHDNVQSGLSPSDTSGLTGTVAWTAAIGQPGTNSIVETANDYLSSPVVGTDGTVYQLGFDGNLSAFNPDGGLQWKTMLEGPVADPHPGTPIIAKDGTLFVAYGDTEQAGFANGFFHVSAAGAILAAIPPEGNGDGFDLPPILTNGGLLLGADEASGAFAYSIGTGGSFDLANSYQIVASFDQISAVVGPDDTTYWCGGALCTALSPPSSGFTPLASWASGIAGLANGGESWTSDLALDVQFTGNLMVLLGGWGAEGAFGPQYLLSVRPQTAAVVWTDTLPPPTAAQESTSDNFYIGFANATVGNSCPAIGTDGTVYVGNFDGLHAVDGATGGEKTGFPFTTSGDDVLTAPAIGGDGTIFFGTAGGIFYAVHPDGTLRFKLNAGGRIAGSPAIGPDGSVYFMCDDGNLYAVH